jgi:hypothetical protein
MRLQRLTSSYMHAHHADSDAYTVYGDGDEELTASTHFTHFGAGSERFSDFRVSLEWSDVEALIRAFSEKGHQPGDWNAQECWPRRLKKSQKIQTETLPRSQSTFSRALNAI